MQLENDFRLAAPSDKLSSGVMPIVVRCTCGKQLRARDEQGGRRILYKPHIDPYDKAAIVYNHEPTRDRVLLAHKREIRKLESALSERGVTLVPLAIYFKDGRAKVELGVAKGKQQHDKRQTIKKKEADRELRRMMSRRG
jgi:SsrA-binding protein